MSPGRALAAAAMLVLSVLVPVSSASSAAPTADTGEQCDLVAPPRLAVFQTNPVFGASISGLCAGAGVASWRLGGTDNDVYAGQDPTEGAFTVVYTSHLTTWGPQTWQPQGAWRSRAEHDADCPARNGSVVPGPCQGRLTQNAPVTDVRLSAAAWLTATRSYGVVTLTGTSLIYVPGRGFVKRSGASGEIQYAELGSSTWHRLKTVTTTTSGSARVQYRFPRARAYRLALYSTPSSFDITSAVSYR